MFQGTRARIFRDIDKQYLFQDRIHLPYILPQESTIVVQEHSIHLTTVLDFI